MSIKHDIPTDFTDPLRLDGVTIYCDDYEPGRGKLVVVCCGCAWSCYWGAMGDGKTLLQFLAAVDAGYIANNLLQGRRQFISSRKAEQREEAHLLRIAEAVHLYAQEVKRAAAERPLCPVCKDQYEGCPRNYSGGNVGPECPMPL